MLASLDSGDIGAQIAALVIKSGREQKKAERDVQNIETKVEDAEDASQVKAMHDEADDIRSGGLNEGMAEAFSGAFTLGSQAVQLGAAGSKGGDGGNGAASSGGDASNASRARAESAFLDAGATGARAAATILGSFGRAAAKDDETRATYHEHAADHAKRAVDDAHSGVKDAQDLIKTALDFYREFSSTEAQCRSAALHRS